jgi:putative transposase
MGNSDGGPAIAFIAPNCNHNTRHTPQEIIVKLRETEGDLNQGATIDAVCRKLEIGEQTFHRWRHLYGGMKGPEMAWMKELEKENARLKKIVAQQALDIDALKAISRKNW